MCQIAAYVGFPLYVYSMSVDNNVAKSFVRRNSKISHAVGGDNAAIAKNIETARILSEPGMINLSGR
jgi:hypothetical protein